MKIFKNKTLYTITKCILVNTKYVAIPCYILLWLFSITIILINIICITYNHSPKAHKMLTAVVAKKTGIDFHINTILFKFLSNSYAICSLIIDFIVSYCQKSDKFYLNIDTFIR